MNLERFGRELRELRERRGLTQEKVIERTAAYKDSRTLRKIEAGQQRPPRETTILILNKGLEEVDPGVINGFLQLLDYELLRDAELARFGLVAKTSPALETEPIQPPTRDNTQRVGTQRLKTWRIVIFLCAIAAIALNVVVRDVFVMVTALLYAGLYADSLMLESAHEFHGEETITAACLASAVIWPSSLMALWADMWITSPAGEWIAIGTFVSSAVLQWFLVQPALPPYTIVPAKFQPHTGRTAHLKNTIYFLMFVFPFWVVPAHCVAMQRHSANARAPGTIAGDCPAPLWLWLLLATYVGASIPMGHYLLSNLEPGPYLNRYQTFYYGRALLFFLLSFICVLWYSSM